MTKLNSEKKVARGLQDICDAERAKLGRPPTPYQRCLNIVRKHGGVPLPGDGPFAARLFDAYRDELLR